MTDLSQQNPQYFVQSPPPTAQPYGGQTPMIYSPQQFAPSYPPQQPYLTDPSQQQGAPYMSNPYGDLQAEKTGHASLTMSDVPLQNVSSEQGNFTQDHSYGMYEADKPPHFEEHHPYIPSPLPGVVTCGDVISWYKEAWAMYAENWIPYTVFTFVLCLLVGGSILVDDETPWVVGMIWSLGSYLSFPLYYGYFIAGSQIYKQRELMMQQGTVVDYHITPRLQDFLRGYFVFFPLLGYAILLPLLTGIGLFLIIPGVYLLVTLTFAPCIYIEYHRQSIYEPTQQATITYDFCSSIGQSVRVTHKHFWEVAFFLLLALALNFLGAITAVGVLVTLPVTSLAMVPAFRDLFQFQLQRAPDETCYCC